MPTTDSLHHIPSERERHAPLPPLDRVAGLYSGCEHCGAVGSTVCHWCERTCCRACRTQHEREQGCAQLAARMRLSADLRRALDLLDGGAS